jgi:hypothetical protein
MHERKRGEGIDAFGQSPFLAEDIGRLDEPLNRRDPRESIGQPGRVAHEVLDRDRPLEWGEIEPAAVFDADFHIREGRDVRRHRIDDREPTFLDERHCSDGNDGLGHRIDAEDGVLAQSRALRTQQAEALAIGDLAVARDQHRDARRLFVFNLAGHYGRQALEPVRQKANVLGGRIGQHE